MCSECHQYPCHPQCPNAPEPPKVYTCKHCNEDIVVGDECYEYDGDYYHEDCFNDCAVEILLEAGARKFEAEEEEPDYDPYDD